MKRSFDKSFEKTILDTDVPNKKVKFFPSGNRLKPLTSKLVKLLPDPLVPTKYKPVPKPRTKQKKQKPVALPRNQLPKRVQEKVKNLIDEINPYYEPEAIRALKNNAKSFEVPIVNKYDASIQLYDTKRLIEELFRSILEKKRGFKFNMTLQIRLSKQTGDGKVYREPYFNSGAFTVTNAESMIESIEIAIEKILNLIAVWLSEGSGWVIELVLHHYLHIVTYLPLKGKSYIELPECLRNPMKGLVNLQNKDNECFRWCHVRYLNPPKNYPQRIKLSDREYAKQLDYSGVTFPVTVKDMGKIEKQNKININVFGLGKHGTYPIRVSKEQYIDHLELLWIEGKNGNCHYVLIYNFNRFMSSFTKSHHVKHFCMHCLKCCSSARTLEMHQVDCIAINGVQRIRMPNAYTDKNGEKRIPKVYFKNYKKMLPVPFVIYADFESITEKIHGCLPNDNKSYTTTYQNHKACGFGYKVVCHYDKRFSKPIEIYRGEDTIEQFIFKMFEEVEDCKRVMREKFNKPLVMTSEKEKSFQSSNKCHICERYFKSEDKLGNDEKKDKVRDHCHITG